MPMIAASSGSYDLALVLGNLLLILVIARVAAELAERVKVPPVLGEIVAGILIGPSVLGWIDPIAHLEIADMVLLIGEIGVILLLFQVGLEMDLGELRKVGRSALQVAVIGVAAPFALGIAVAGAFGEAGKIAIFIGAALTATSVGITARVLGDLRALSTKEARIVLGAAVADDVLGLVILTVVVKIVTEGSIGPGIVLETVGLAVGFLVVTGLLSVFVVPRVLDKLHGAAKSSNTVVVAGFALTIAFSLLANQAKLAFIIGAFMAGLGIGRSAQHERIADGLNPLANVFIPVFFASIGINADLEAMLKPHVLALAGCLTVVAVIGKLVSVVGVSGKADRLLIGVGMIPRGEVGLIFASIGLSKGVLDKDLYGALLVMVLLTTLMTPPLLTMRLRRTGAATEMEPIAAEHEPEGGWLQVDGDRLVLAGTPATSLTVPLALRAAELSALHAVDDGVFDWFGSHRTERLEWRPSDTEQLLDLLRDGSPRSWRTLATTGVLERALPEVGRAADRRRADAEHMDGSHSLHFPLVDRLRELNGSPGIEPTFDALYARLEHPDLLTLAAFVSDATDDGRDAVSLAERLRRSDSRTVMRILGLAEALSMAARGPDISVDDVLARIDDPQLAAGSLAMALLSTTDVIRATLDEVASQVVFGG
jgi:Kef-type K+ transport system membrane component KefB